MDAPTPDPTDPTDPRAVAVVGAGLMGHAIALEFALAGLAVRLTDRTDAILAAAIDTVADDLAALVRLGRVEQAAVAPTLARIGPTTDLGHAVAGADLVVEAISEDLDRKRRLFADLDRRCPPHVVLASNTSSFMPSLLAAGIRHPERLLVTHYFNPAHLLPLVEVVPHPATDEAVVARVVRLLRGIGKAPVVVRQEAPGFVGNRLQMALLREAAAIVAAGIATAADVDAVVTAGFGRRLAVAGPFAVADLAGLDVTLRVMEELLPSLASEREPPPMLRDAVAAGRLGVKTVAGLYDWSPDAIRAARERVAAAIAAAPPPVVAGG
jgi:3-hydroxybutyryl-CoA dehydrogenase